PPRPEKASPDSEKATLIGGEMWINLGFNQDCKGAIVDRGYLHHGAESSFFNMNIPRAQLLNDFVDYRLGRRPLRIVCPRWSSAFGRATLERERTYDLHR